MAWSEDESHLSPVSRQQNLIIGRAGERMRLPTAIVSGTLDPLRCAENESRRNCSLKPQPIRLMLNSPAKANFTVVVALSPAGMLVAVVVFPSLPGFVLLGATSISYTSLVLSKANKSRQWKLCWLNEIQEKRRI